MSTESASTQFRFIPVRQLGLPPLNVRKTAGAEGIAALAELINAEGVLQNLSVYECRQENGEAQMRYAVIAGGRRWRALQRLLDEGRIASEYPGTVHRGELRARRAHLAYRELRSGADAPCR